MTVDQFFERLDNIDRRVIYLFVIVSLAAPLIWRVSLPPAEMKSAEKLFNVIQTLEKKPKELVLIAFDWGPNTQAENKPQTEVAVEHLMRRRLPFAVITNYALAAPFLEAIPEDVAEKLEQEYPGETWEYGRDWVNLGFRPGGYTMIEGFAKSEDLHRLWRTDAFGAPVEQLPILKDIKTIRSIPLLMQFTGLTNLFNYWLQFFFVEGHSPLFVHGCTSITIPDAHTYLASKQIAGLHEGIAGAAWHEKLMNEAFPERKINYSWGVNTGLAYAHLVILAFMALGNIGLLVRTLRTKRGAT